MCPPWAIRTEHLNTSPEPAQEHHLLLSLPRASLYGLAVPFALTVESLLQSPAWSFCTNPGEGRWSGREGMRGKRSPGDKER